MSSSITTQTGVTEGFSNSIGELLPTATATSTLNRNKNSPHPHPQSLNNYYCCIEQKESEEKLFSWLHSLQLIHHFDKFLDHGYEDLGICMEIGESDLHAIGVSDIHERLAILQAVRQLRAKQSQTPNNAKNQSASVSSSSSSSSSSSVEQSRNSYNNHDLRLTSSTSPASSSKNKGKNKSKIQSIPLRSISATQGHTTIPTICSWNTSNNDSNSITMFQSSNSNSQTCRNTSSKKKSSSSTTSSPFTFSFSLKSKKSATVTAPDNNNSKKSKSTVNKSLKKSIASPNDDILIVDHTDWKSSKPVPVSMQPPPTQPSHYLQHQSQNSAPATTITNTTMNGKSSQFINYSNNTVAKRPTNFKNKLPTQSYIPSVSAGAATIGSKFSQIHCNSKMSQSNAIPSCYPSCLNNSSNLKLNPHGFLHGSLVALNSKFDANSIQNLPPIPGPGPLPPPCARIMNSNSNANQINTGNTGRNHHLPFHLSHFARREFQEYNLHHKNKAKLDHRGQSSPGHINDDDELEHPNYVDVNEDGEVVEPLYETVSPVPVPVIPVQNNNRSPFRQNNNNNNNKNRPHNGLPDHHHDDMCGYSVPMLNFPMSRSTPHTPKKQHQQQQHHQQHNHTLFRNHHNNIIQNHHNQNQNQSSSTCCHTYDDENVDEVGAGTGTGKKTVTGGNLSSNPNNCGGFPCCGGNVVGGGGISNQISSVSVPVPDQQSSATNLILLRTQLRDQVMQDGINISRISDESILRTMAAQYAAELASTLTLTPSSNSACSSTSASSNSSSASSSASAHLHHHHHHHQSASSAASSNSSCSMSGQICGQQQQQQQQQPATPVSPSDLHYQQVYHQLRELWLEERMKLFPIIPAQNYGLDDSPSPGGGSSSANKAAGLIIGCTCGPATQSPRGGGFPFKSSSCSSTPCVTTPTGPGNGLGHGLGGGPVVGLQSAGSFNKIPTAVTNGIKSCGENQFSGSASNLNLLKSNSSCKSPERNAPNSASHHQQPHQYLQHVIISNSSFGSQQVHPGGGPKNQSNNSNPAKSISGQSNHSNSASASAAGGGSGAGAGCGGEEGSVPKQTYKPGIYLPSSCLLDKDEIYDYAPPVRISPERTPANINNNSKANANHASQNLYSPSKRCFVGQKGGGKSALSSPRHSNGGSAGGVNGISTIRGSSKSSYAFSPDPGNGGSNGNCIYGGGGGANNGHGNSNYAHMSPGSHGSGGVKPGCRTLANLSKLSRRLGLSRFFRTLRIHGNNGGSGGGSSGTEEHSNSMNMNVTRHSSHSNNFPAGSAHSSSSSSGSSGGRMNTNDLCSNENYSAALRTSYLNDSHLNSELNSISQRLYGSSTLNQNHNQNQRFSQTNTLPDLTQNQGNPGSKGNGAGAVSDKGSSISSLPSNERIIETINRLKLEELQKRKERIAQEHQMVRDTLYYMLPRN